MTVENFLFLAIACFTIIITLDICPDAIKSVTSFLKGVFKDDKHE